MTRINPKSKIKALACLALSICLVLSLSPSALAVSQAEIDALKRQKEELLERKGEKQAEVDALREEENRVVELKLALDERNALTIEQMELVSEELQLCEDMIKQKEKELDEARELEAEQLERYQSRVRAMEENGSYNFLALLLNADGFSGLLTAIDDIQEIMEYDRQLEDMYIAARENTEQVYADYLKTKAELEERQVELKAEQAELEAQLGETILLMEEIKARLGSEAELLDQLNAQVEATQNEIDSMVAELEAIRQQQAAAGGGGGGGSVGGGSVSSAGDFSWPCPGVTYITSRYGPRYHPVTGNFQSTHTGLDIGASYGSAISCAAAGTVSFSGVKGGYGNCVMVDHGGGYYTLYAHMSSIAVSKGQAVSSGTTIGYVGDTGIVSGPHLHFEIRINGATVDPAPYFSGLTYAPDA